MSDVTGGGPAFPTFETLETYDNDAGKYREVVQPCGGMSLRDYFAAKALVGLLAGQTEVACEAISYTDKAATWAYKFADSMLKARDKR